MTDQKRRAARAVRVPARRLGIALVCVALTFMVRTSLAFAHADLVGATPGPDTTQHRAPRLVRLQFSEELNDALSTIEVWDGRGSRVDQGAAQTVRGNQMIAPLNRRLRPGTYVVTWDAISAGDGHATTGAYTFNMVRAGLLRAGIVNSGTGRVSGLGATLARWIELTTGAGWLGLMIFSVFILRRRVEAIDTPVGFDRAAVSRGCRMVPGVLMVLLGGSTLTLLIEAHEVIPDWSRDLSWRVINGLVFHTPYGALWLVRQSLVLVALALWGARWWIVRRRGRSGGSRDATPWGDESIADYSLAVAVGYGLILAASGHAASVSAGGTGILGAPVLLDWLHVLASGMWIGGIFAVVTILAPVLPSGLDEDAGVWFLGRLDRFSPLAYGSVACLAVTGAFNAGVHLAGWSDLWLTVYGRALLTKLSVISVMFVLSGFTIVWLRPGLRSVLLSRTGSATVASDQRRLLGYLRLNAVLGALLFLATAVMNTYPISGGSPLS